MPLWGGIPREPMCLPQVQLLCLRTWQWFLSPGHFWGPPICMCSCPRSQRSSCRHRNVPLWPLWTARPPEYVFALLTDSLRVSLSDGCVIMCRRGRVCVCTYVNVCTWVLLTCRTKRKFVYFRRVVTQFFFKDKMLFCQLIILSKDLNYERLYWKWNEEAVAWWKKYKPELLIHP